MHQMTEGPYPHSQSSGRLACGRCLELCSMGVWGGLSEGVAS